MAMNQREVQKSKGDAEGHLAARAISMTNTVSTSGSKWLASTGTGELLDYVKSRNMKVALLPKPFGINGDNKNIADEGNRMEDFMKQLPRIKFDVVIKSCQETTGHESERTEIPAAKTHIPTSVLNTVLTKTNIPPIATLIVSDRDDYLEAGRSLGMYTCRIHVPNTRKGVVHSHFIVTNVSEVENIVNELNGISFTSARGNIGINYGGV